MSSGTTLMTPGKSDIMVLLVDDQIMIGEAIRRALHSEPGIHFHFCPNAAEAVAMAREMRPTVILQDLVMPGVEGLDLVRQYRADPGIGGVPIIVLSTKEQPAIKSEAFAAGANDYLVKLPDRIELVARIRYHSRAYQAQLQRDEAYRALRESQQQLMDANLELQRLTKVDGLTGLSNRRYFDTYLEAEFARAMRNGTALAVLMIDVDEFKRFNDSYGHPAGDEVLKAIAAAIQAQVHRATDLAARYGGEEFVMVLVDPSAGHADVVAEALCLAIEAMHLPHRASSVGPCVTASIGVAVMVPVEGQSPLQVVDAADRALYRAKRGGRNRVVLDPAP